MPNPWEQPNAWAMPDDIQKYIALRERALQQQQQQEPPTPADMVTAETMQGVNANRDAYNQQQVQAQMQPQQQPYLTPQTAHLLGLIVNNKDAYENADTYTRLNNPNEKDEAVLSALANDMRTAAHAGNDRIRELAKAIGLDLNGYENVGYQDAYNTLQDRKAKEIAELMGNTGRYSVSTDQFYNDNYLALIGEGKSAREAKRIAGRRAQEYQADRVTYLRNAFNVHGLDGNYVNGTGVDILNEMAEEMPTVANVYATAYKLPTHAQTRYETLEDKNLQQMFDLQRGEQNFLHNWGLQGQALDNNLILRNNDSRLRREEAQWQSDLDFAKAIKTSQYTTDAARNAMFQKYNDIVGLAINSGFKPEDAKTFGLAAVGITVPKAGEKTDDKTIENVNKMFTMLDNYEKNLLKELEGKDGAPIDEERANAIKQQVDAIRAQKNQLLGFSYTTLGISGLGQQPEEEAAVLTGNWNHDGPLIEEFRKDAQSKGYSWQQIKQMVYKQLLEAGYTEENAKQAAGLE